MARLHLKPTAALLIAVIGLGVWLTLKSEPVATRETATVGGQETFQFHFPLGMEYRYDLRYATHQRAALPGPRQARGPSADEPIEGEIKLHVPLVLRSHGDGYGPSGHRYLLGASIERCDDATLRLFGQTLWASVADCEESMVGPELLFEIDRRGAIQSVYDPPEEHQLFTHTMSTLLKELQVQLRSPRSEWQLSEATPHGTANSSYVLADGSGWGADEALALVRSRRSYASLHAIHGQTPPEQQVEASQEIRLSPNGHLLELAGNERLTASRGGIEILDVRTSLSLRLTGVTRVAPARKNLAGLTGHSLDRQPTSSATKRQMLAQRVNGLTLDQAVRTLAEFGGSGEVPDHNRFLWRVTGLLTLHPEHCEALEQLFVQPTTTLKGRALMLDILADVGHPEAQASLRRLLDVGEIQEEANYPLLLQRLSFVAKPEPETIAWVEQRYRDSDAPDGRNDHLASAYTLGSLAGRASEAGDAGEASRLNRLIRQGLADTDTPRDVAHYVTALGAAGLEDNIDVFEHHAGSPYATVRHAAAGAAAKLSSPEARALLVGLASDPSATVQGHALRLLQQKEVSATDLSSVAEAMRSGGLHQGNVRAALDLARRGQPHHPDAADALLAAVLESGVTDVRARTAIRQLRRSI